MILDKNLFKAAEGKKESLFSIEQIKIKNGKLVFKINKATIKVNNLNLTSVRNEEKIVYYIKTPFLEAEFPIQNSMVKFYGRFVGKLYQQNKNIELASANWKTENFNIRLSGIVSGKNGTAITANFSGNPEKILYPVLKEFNLSGFLSSRINITKKKKEALKLSGRFKSKSFYVGKEKFSNLRGEGNWSDSDKRVIIKGYMQSAKIRSFMTVNTEPPKTFIKVKNFPTAKAGKLVSIYSAIPLGGIIETGSVEIDKENILGEILIKNIESGIADFNVDGIIDFNFKKKDKVTLFRSQRLKTEFGELAIEGMYNSKNKGLQINARAKISAMDGINKYSNFFIGLDLSRWNLKQGTGFFSLGLDKQSDQLRFDAQFLGKDFFTNGKTIDSLSMNMQKKSGLITGNIEIDDRALKTKALITISKNDTVLDFTEVNGKSEKIFKILNIPSPTVGNITGICKYIQPKGNVTPKIYGKIRSEELFLSGFKFTNVSCDFQSDIDSLSLKDVDFIFMDGKGNANIAFDFLKSEYELTGEVNDVNIKKVYNGLSGKGKIDFAGKGRFLLDPIIIKYNFSDIRFYEDKKFLFEGSAKVFTDFNDFSLVTDGEIRNLDFKSDFSFDLKKKREKYSGNYIFNIKDINLLIPWKNNIGEISIQGNIDTDKNNKFLNAGIANFKGKTLVIPDFSQAIEDYSGFITFDNNKFSLKSLMGTLGGGVVELNGFINLNEDGIDRAQLNLTGNKMLIFPMNRTQFDMGANLSLKYFEDQLSFDGDIKILSGIWEREIDEGISFFTSSKLSPDKADIIKNMTFNLRISGSKNIKMSNTFGRMTGGFDLTLKGTPETPIILGVIEGQSGEIYFSGNKFRLQKAKILFNNKFEINPEIIIKSEAFIKNYRIKFNVKGTADKPLPEFKSSPVLSPQEILTLISLGELFEKQRSIEFSSQKGSTYLINNALMDKIQKRAKKFGINLLRIDPSLSEFSTDNSPRLTVGTAILKDMLIVYSTNITGLRRQVYYFQYQLSPAISLIGMRNEAGRFSVDIRFRKKD